MKELTTLEDFCNFIENELGISMSNEQRKIYNEQKTFSLVNERNEMIDSYNAGRNSLITNKTAKEYIIEKYNELI